TIAAPAPALETTAALPPLPPTSLAGAAMQRLGRFEIHKHLGSGAFGDVYRAVDSQLQRDVALKVPRPGVLANPNLIERFLREAKPASARRNGSDSTGGHDAG